MMDFKGKDGNDITENLQGEDMLNLDFVDEKKEDGFDEVPWYPVEGDSIIGELLNVKLNVGKYHQTVYVLRDHTDQKRSIFGCKILDTLMEDVFEGQYVKITYLGKKNGKSGWEYKQYKVQTPRGG